MQASQPQHTPLPKGTYYLIINKSTQKSLTPTQPSPKNHHKSTLTGTQINPQDNNQIFMIERMDTYGTNYEIVCCASDYVFEEHHHDVVLADGKRSKSQMFGLVPITGGGKLLQYYAVRSVSRPDLALALEGSLRLATFDVHNVTQHFRFQEVNNYTLQNSCLLVNNYCGKAIDVPGGTDKQGERIIVWEKNKRWNQRWIFQKVGSVHLIKNVLNGLCLDVAGQSRESGAKIVQWPQTGGTNQLWIIEQAGDKLYKIWSYHEPTLCLALRKQEGADGSYLEITNHDNPTTYWRIEGAKPK